jgi:hypothetical protein
LGCNVYWLGHTGRHLKWYRCHLRSGHEYWSRNVKSWSRGNVVAKYVVDGANNVFDAYLRLN